MVVCTRIVGDQETKPVRFYSFSLPSDAIRKNWVIENELHWVLDVAPNEDHSWVHKDQAPENLAVIRHSAVLAADN